MKKKQKTTVVMAESLLQRHFGKQKLHELVTASRTFPVTARVDLQSALEKLFAEYPGSQVIGCHTQFTHEMLTVARLLRNPHYPVVVAPLQHEEIDIGDALPARCLKQALCRARIPTGSALQFSLVQQRALVTNKASI